VQGIGTKIDGGTKAKSFPGVTDIVIQLGSGNDTADVFNGTLSGRIQVEYDTSGTGTKTTQLINLNIEFIGFHQDVQGKSFVTISNASMFGGIDLFTGPNNDVISLTNVYMGAGMDLNAGDGKNVISVANINSRSSSSDVIFAGNGRDVIAVSHYFAASGLEVEASDGTDNVALSGVTVGNGTLDVEAGPGNSDVVAVVDCTADMATFSDTGGTNGYIVGAANHFGTQSIDPNFTHRFGDLQHDK
jgi:hypothetical protein